jgi:formylmethanofuran dehydrogenase subunit D
MGFGQFMAKPEFDITIVTHRDVFQNSAQETSRFGEDYRRLSAFICLDAGDMKKMGIEEKTSVLLKNKWGKVVVKAVLSKDETGHPGIGFMVSSPWSNALVSPETDGNGVPDFRRIKATVSSTAEKMPEGSPVEKAD